VEATARGGQSAILELERAAFDAWPAEDVRELDGFRLRAMGGLTRRANSAWTAEATGERPLDELITMVEAFYGERGLPSQFMLSPLSPANLEGELERRGYRVDAPVAVQTVSAPALAALDASRNALVEATPSAAWLELVVKRGRFRQDPGRFMGLLSRIRSGALYPEIGCDAVTASVALSVMHGELIGVFGMFTLPEYRRQGLARALLVGLAREAVRRGFRTVYLQVERDNQAALSLYASLGFSERYGYHYRVLEPR
jgi:GNAT superfamily N-acetyltransferase